jgi:predicted alpha/beta-hydrolase family hydrolase
MRTERRGIDCGKHGTVSAVIAYPPGHRPGATPTVVLAHGAGNDMTNPLLSGVHEGLAQRGLVAVKFNFPYTEQGRRAPDRAPVLEACYRAVIDAIRADPALAPQTLIIGGKSMGGRMASHLAAQGVAVAGLLFLGYPLHPAGRPDKLRVAHLSAISAPMLFFAGTRDALCSLDLLREALAELPRATLHVIEGGDHSFALPRRLRRSAQEVIEQIVGASVDWIERIARC